MTSFEIFSWTARSIRDHPSITIWNLHLAHVIIPNDVNRKVLIARSDIFIKSIDSSLSLGARNAWDLFRFRVYVRIFLCPSLWNSLRPFFMFDQSRVTWFSFLIRFQTVNSSLNIVFTFQSWFCQFPESRISLEFSSWSSIKNNGEVRDNPAGSVDATANTSNITRIIWKRSCKYYIVFKNIIGRGDSMILTFDVPPLTDNSNCLIWLKDRARTSLFYEIFLKTLCYTV